jgi:hypothetical protein
MLVRKLENISDLSDDRLLSVHEVWSNLAQPNRANTSAVETKFHCSCQRMLATA